MSLRSVVLITALAFTGCGSWVCDATTCADGCCAEDGVCVVPDDKPSDDLCGIGGAACLSCGEGRSCVAGVCMCSPSTCAGCCDPASGACVDGLSAGACGSGGQTCTSCEASRLSCVTDDGASAHCGQPTCAQTCSGCCTDLGECLSGDSDESCGQNGGACNGCTDYNTCFEGSCL